MAINVAPPNTNPDSSPFPEVYQAQPRSFFLANIIATLNANGLRLYPLNRPGDPIHRFLDGVANELARISRSVQDIIVRAIYEAGFRAEGLILEEGTYATGTQQFTRVDGVATVAEVIPINTLIIGASGRSVRTLSAVTVGIGQTTITALVRAEVIGVSGNAPAGEFTSVLASLPSPYRTTNITPISGGREEESQIERFARFRALKRSRRFGSSEYIIAQLLNVPPVSGFSVRQTAIIQPWRVPELGGNVGVVYAVIEAGGGTAPLALVNAAQTVANDSIVAGDACIVLSSSAYVVNLTISVRFALGTNPVTAIAALQATYATAFRDARIEDGSGNGEYDLNRTLDALQSANPSLILPIRLISPTATTIKPALGALIVPSVLIVVQE